MRRSSGESVGIGGVKRGSNLLNSRGQGQYGTGVANPGNRVRFSAQGQQRSRGAATGALRRPPSSTTTFDYSSASDDEDIDRWEREEQEQERLLSEQYGEASEAGGGNGEENKKRKKTDQEVAAELEQETRKKQRQQRPKLTAQDLMGMDGLIRIPTEFKRIKYDTKAKNKVQAARDYSNKVMNMYKSFCYDLYPALAMEDTMLRIEKLGSKKEIKSFIQNMRDEVRNNYVESIYGKDKASRMISELEHGLQLQRQLQLDDMMNQGEHGVDNGELQEQLEELEEGNKETELSDKEAGETEEGNEEAEGPTTTINNGNGRIITTGSLSRSIISPEKGENLAVHDGDAEFGQEEERNLDDVNQMMDVLEVVAAENEIPTNEDGMKGSSEGVADQVENTQRAFGPPGITTPSSQDNEVDALQESNGSRTPESTTPTKHESVLNTPEQSQESNIDTSRVAEDSKMYTLLESTPDGSIDIQSSNKISGNEVNTPETVKMGNCSNKNTGISSVVDENDKKEGASERRAKSSSESTSSIPSTLPPPSLSTYGNGNTDPEASMTGNSKASKSSSSSSSREALSENNSNTSSSTNSLVKGMPLEDHDDETSKDQHSSTVNNTDNNNLKVKPLVEMSLSTSSSSEDATEDSVSTANPSLPALVSVGNRDQSKHQNDNNDVEGSNTEVMPPDDQEASDLTDCSVTA